MLWGLLEAVVLDEGIPISTRGINTRVREFARTSLGIARDVNRGIASKVVREVARGMLRSSR